LVSISRIFIDLSEEPEIIHLSFGVTMTQFTVSNKNGWRVIFKKIYCHEHLEIGELQADF